MLIIFSKKSKGLGQCIWKILLEFLGIKSGNLLGIITNFPICLDMIILPFTLWNPRNLKSLCIYTTPPHWKKNRFSKNSKEFNWNFPNDLIETLIKVLSYYVHDHGNWFHHAVSYYGISTNETLYSIGRPLFTVGLRRQDLWCLGLLHGKASWSSMWIEWLVVSRVWQA